MVKHLLHFTVVLFVSLGLMACSTNPYRITTVKNQPKAHPKAKVTKKNSQSNVTIKKTGGVAPSSLSWQWPAEGLILPKVKSIDIAGREGTIIKAASDGVVAYSGHGLKQYGYCLIIKHNENFVTVYAHNKELKVKEGERVTKGQVIALMGKSGAERVKLHFEVRYQGKPQDPLRFLPKI